MSSFVNCSNFKCTNVVRPFFSCRSCGMDQNDCQCRKYVDSNGKCDSCNSIRKTEKCCVTGCDEPIFPCGVCKNCGFIKNECMCETFVIQSSWCDNCDEKMCENNDCESYHKHAAFVLKANKTYLCRSCYKKQLSWYDWSCLTISNAPKKVSRAITDAQEIPGHIPFNLNPINTVRNGVEAVKEYIPTKIEVEIKFK